MDTSDRRSQTLAALEASVCSDADIVFVVAFGSRILGTETKGSDLDVAIKFADELSDRERFAKRCFLAGDLQREDTPSIDVSDIETLPVDIAYDAINGLFVCGDRDLFEQFKTDVEMTFAERHDELRDQQRTVIERIAEEGLRG